MGKVLQCTAMGCYIAGKIFEYYSRKGPQSGQVDHRFTLKFKSFVAAQCTLAGVEFMHISRKNSWWAGRETRTSLWLDCSALWPPYCPIDWVHSPQSIRTRNFAAEPRRALL